MTLPCGRHSQTQASHLLLRLALLQVGLDARQLLLRLPHLGLPPLPGQTLLLATKGSLTLQGSCRPSGSLLGVCGQQHESQPTAASAGPQMGLEVSSVNSMGSYTLLPGLAPTAGSGVPDSLAAPGHGTELRADWRQPRQQPARQPVGGCSMSAYVR